MHSFDGCSLVNELVSNQEQRNERKFEDYEKDILCTHTIGGVFLL